MSTDNLNNTMPIIFLPFHYRRGAAHLKYHYYYFIDAEFTKISFGAVFIHILV